MYPRILVLAFLATAALFTTATPASAQLPIGEGQWLVTPLIGLALDEDADASLAIGGGAVYLVAPNVGVEGELGHVFDMAPGAADVDSALTTVHGSLLYFFNTGFVAVPYVAGGLGIGKFSHRVTRPPVDIQSTEVGFNLGGGVAYPLADGIAARGELRFFKHIDDVPSVWRLGLGVSFRIGD